MHSETKKDGGSVTSKLSEAAKQKIKEHIESAAKSERNASHESIESPTKER